MILLENLSRSYRDGDRTISALSGVELFVPRAATIALVGKSGSGKSTLLHLIGGVEWPSSGTVSVDGILLRSLADRELASFRLHHIGFVFQSFHLLPTLTVLENLVLPGELAGLPKAERQLRAMTLLDKVELKERATTYPDRLSGGEQQRVAIARALMLNPPVLLADEPTGNLDSETGAAVLELMWRLAGERGSTVIIATHSAEAAERADRRIELKDGRVVGDSAPTSPSLQNESRVLPP